MTCRIASIASLVAGLLFGIATSAWSQTAPPADTAETALDTDTPPAATPSAWEPLRLNTFGTVGASRLNVRGTHLRADATASFGVGDGWTGEFDNRLGVQLGTTVAGSVDLAWQLMLRRQNDGEFGPDTNWLYAGWRFAPDWELKGGRFMSPLYLVSDQKLVGLTQPWIHAPSEVYGLQGNVDSLDGLWLRRSLPLGERTLTLDLIHARHREQHPGFSVNLEPISAIGLGLSQDNWTWHAMAARSTARLSVDAASPLSDVVGFLSNPLLGGNATAAAEYDIGRIRPLRFISTGLRYDATPWLVMAEVAAISSHNRAIPGNQAGYLTLGRNWGPWLIYARAAHLRARPVRAETRFGEPLNSQLIQPYLASLAHSGQTTYSVGTRWDITRGVAFKLQADAIRPRGPNGSGGLFLEPVLPAGRRVGHFYSVTLDWAY